MNTRAILGVALTGVVVLVSCTQDQPSAPIRPSEASLARSTPVNYCSISTISNAAKAYFALRNDPVYGLIETLKTAYNAGGVTSLATNDAGFAVLGRLGVAADAPSTLVKPTATPAMGSAVANAVLKCMTVTGFTPADGQVIDFSDELGPTGLFAVRSNAQSDAVYSRGLDGENNPMFGAEPTSNGTSSNWPIKTSGGATGEAVSPTGKALFYGWKTQDNTGTLSNEDLSSVAFELSTLPAPLTFSPKIKVGVCSVEDQAARTVHVHDGDASILAPAGLLSFCSTSSGSLSPNSGVFAFATRQLTSWFAPKPLFAAPVAFGGGGAGLVDGLSQFGAVDYDAAITWDTMPAPRTTLTTSPQFRPIITLTVKTANGTPYVGTVTLTVIGNSGSFNIDGEVEDTNADGVVTFPDLYIDKAGGYTMTAVTGIGTSSPVTFWINGQ